MEKSRRVHREGYHIHRWLILINDSYSFINENTARGLTLSKKENHLKKFEKIRSLWDNSPKDLDKRSLAKWFRNEILAIKYPRLFEHLKSIENPKYICLHSVFKYLFPRAGCAYCGKLLNPKNKISFCKGKCHSLLKYGVDHKNKLPEVRAEISARSIAYFSDPKARQNIGKHTKARWELLTEEEKQIYLDRLHTGQKFWMNSLTPEERSARSGAWWESLTEKERKAVGNNLRRVWKNKTKEERRAHWDNLSEDMKEERGEKFKRFWKNLDPLSKSDMISRRLQTVKNFSAKKKKGINEKRQQTSLENYGVSHPMKHPDILLKNHLASYKIKETTYKGKDYKYQGWEDCVVNKLIDKYKAKNVFTQFDEGFPTEIYIDAGTIPDVWIKNLDKFVEVKSIYTLLGSDKIFQSNKYKAENLYEAGYICRYVIVKDYKNKEVKVLPKNWYSFSKKKIQKFLEE